MNWNYLGRELTLILIGSYMFLVGGTFTGLIAHPARVASAVLAAAVFGCWLLWRLLRGEKIASAGLDRAWLLLLVGITIAVLFSEDPRRSQSHGLIWFSYALAFYLAVDLLRRGWPAELLEKCVLIAGSLVIAFGLLQLSQLYSGWRAATAGLQYPPSFQYRISSIIGDPNLLAVLLNLLIPLALTRGIVSRSRGAQGLLGLFLAASLLLVYFADSRGGFLALATALGIVALGWVGVLSERAGIAGTELWKTIRGRRGLLLGLSAGLLLVGSLAAWRFFSFEGDTTHAPALTSREIYWQSAAAAFRADPVSGVGPGMYPTYLMRLWSTPPARPYLHAHSTPFNIAAETGLLGFSALLIFLTAAWRRAKGGWRDLDATGKARWVGIAAALGGFAVHALVDDFIPFSAIGIMVMLLLAMWLAPTRQGEAARGFSPLWLLVPAAVGVVLSVNPLRASGLAEGAAGLANAGDWAAAASDMDAAAESDPDFAFYWMQSGYIYGRLAVENPVYADAAMSSYERALQMEPIYSLNYANLAALQWQAGLEIEALANMETATQLAPGAWQFWLNLGVYRENRDETGEAESAYRTALDLRPDLAQAAFWMGNEFRQQIAASLSGSAADPANSRQTARALVVEAREAIRAGQLAEAGETLATAWRLNDQDLALYLGFAELAIAEGDLESAEQYLRAGLGVQSTTNQEKSEMILLQAEISDRRGEAEDAVELFEAAMAAILNLNSYGWGGRGWTPYGFFVFQRQGVAEDLLPQLVRADIPVQIAERLLRLADLYEAADEAEKAAELRIALKPHLP